MAIDMELISKKVYDEVLQFCFFFRFTFKFENCLEYFEFVI